MGCIQIPPGFSQNDIVQIFEKQHSKMNEAITVIIDRRESENESDKMYILLQRIDSRKLTQNYSISLQFDYDSFDDVIRCYLFYGLSHHQKTRFFAEYLTTFIPRLFVKKQSLNSAQRLKKIFADAFKHGFCANLSGDE